MEDLGGDQRGRRCGVRRQRVSGEPVITENRNVPSVVGVRMIALNSAAAIAFCFGTLRKAVWAK
jgi:hypothetical protein